VMDRGASPRGPLVVGIGNVLLRDEGVGVAVVRSLEADDGNRLPAGTRLVDGGTLGLDLLPLIETGDPLVLVDAVDLDAEPGSVHVLRGPQLETALGGHVSPHQVGVADLIAAARLLGRLPDRVSLVGIQPQAIAIGLELTDVVARAVPVAAELTRRELAEA
jgi:hydrogenase maturation protease